MQTVTECSRRRRQTPSETRGGNVAWRFSFGIGAGNVSIALGLCTRSLRWSFGNVGFRESETPLLVRQSCPKCAERIARVLLPLGEGGPKGRMRVDLLPSPAAFAAPSPRGRGTS